MSCFLCGEKGFYLAGGKEFCVNHKQEAVQTTPVHQRTAKVDWLKCECGKHFRGLVASAHKCFACSAAEKRFHAPRIASKHKAREAQ